MALQIAKQKKPHNIGETLVKPCAVNMVKLILGEASAKKIQQVSLSKDTIKRPISLMATDVKQQVIAEIKSFSMFSIQVDESTDVASCLQLVVFVRYIHREDVKEEFLYCKALATSATAQDVMDSIPNFFRYRRLAVGKALWCMYRWSPSMAGMQIWFPNESQRKIS